ncbi:MAG: ATP-binding protein [Bacillota bacterium]
MLRFENQIVKITIIFLCLILISLVVLHNFYSTYSISSGIEKNLKLSNMSEEVYKDVVKITSTANELLSSRDQAIAAEFKHLSKDAINHQLDLYSSIDPSRKQETMELIEASRYYISFVEKELIPASLSESADLKQVESRLNQLSFDIILKAGAVYGPGRGYDGSFLEIVRNQGDKYLFLQVLLIITLSFLFFEIYKLTKPAMIKNHYLEKFLNSINNPVVIADYRGDLIDYNNKFSDLMAINIDTDVSRNISKLTIAFPHAYNILQPIYDVINNEKELKNHHVTYNNAGKKIELVADYIPFYIMKRLYGVIVIAAHAGAKKDKHVLLDTLETERKRISIEIHDWIGRHMSTMIHSLDYILKLDESGSRDDLPVSLKALQVHCQNAAIEMRAIMNDIHPYLIDRVGLISALESYITTFERLNNIKVYALYQDRSLRVKKKDEIIIYRVIQEALTNVAKHSSATEIDIDFTVSHDTLKIEVTDNGGSTGEFTMGNGLWGMKERANLIGGDIIFTKSDSGFRVVLTVPASTRGV